MGPNTSLADISHIRVSPAPFLKEVAADWMAGVEKGYVTHGWGALIPEWPGGKRQPYNQKDTEVSSLSSLRGPGAQREAVGNNQQSLASHVPSLKITNKQKTRKVGCITLSPINCNFPGDLLWSRILSCHWPWGVRHSVSWGSRSWLKLTSVSYSAGFWYIINWIAYKHHKVAAPRLEVEQYKTKLSPNSVSD